MTLDAPLDGVKSNCNGVVRLPKVGTTVAKELIKIFTRIGRAELERMIKEHIILKYFL